MEFPHTDLSLRMILALSVGLLVGLERESASKDVGIRTFAIIALLGTTCNLIGSSFVVAGFLGVVCLTGFMNVRSMLVSRGLEITTSAALLVIYCLGVIIGDGHVFAPVTVAILMTMLLAWKAELAAFAHGLKLQEIRSAVMLALLTFVIYPVLPSTYIDPWDLFNPKEAWITVIVLAAISFVNYVLLKVYSTKGLYYSALLGGAVNSSAAATEIATALKQGKGKVSPRAIPILLMITVAMFIRNLSVLGIFEPKAIAIAMVPLLGMAFTAVFFITRARQRKEEGLSPVQPLNVSSPVSVRRIFKFGLLFVLLQASGTIGARYLGSWGVLAISFLGGFVSSASATAAAAKLASQHKITPTIAGVATILTSISSAFVNLPLVYQITRDRVMTQKLGLTTVGCILAGLALMALVSWLQYSRIS